MATLPLTADSIAALQQQVGQPVDEQAALRWLVDQEASVARREHVLALLREYHQLQALSPTEASGYVERREANAARRLQKAWRRRGCSEGDNGNLWEEMNRLLRGRAP